MIEERKLKEIEYYDTQAQNTPGAKEAGSAMDFNPFLLESYQVLKKSVKSKFTTGRILDYGCGIGIHLPWLANLGAEVTGIDLSKNSLFQAKQILVKNNIQKVVLLERDCEVTGFAGESFDIVFDGGTFSSLDLNNALQEIHRILKPGGFLIGIETLGHNPFTNFKRKINEWRGKRTTFAAGHIFRIENIEILKKYFHIQQVEFFHIISWLAFPFLQFPGGKLFLHLLEFADHVLLRLFPSLKKYSFKITFTAKKK